MDLAELIVTEVGMGEDEGTPYLNRYLRTLGDEFNECSDAATFIHYLLSTSSL